MRVDPMIAALRGDRAPQRLAQTAMAKARDRWQAAAFPARVLRELEEFSQGASLEECPALHAIFTEAELAKDLVSSLCHEFVSTLAQAPFGHPPFRHGYNGVNSTLLLGMFGSAQLVLQAREPGDYDYSCANFSDALRYDAVLAGEAKGRIVRRAGIGGGESHLFDEAINVAAGSRLAFDCETESLLLEQVSTRLVFLRLHRSPDQPRPTLEYDLASGKKLHQASGDLKSSRQDMMLALLGRMECTQAAPVMAEIALEPGGDSVRWQALREGIALDVACGFPALAEVARRQEDPLSASAGALRAQLIEAHPQLLDLEKNSCRA